MTLALPPDRISLLDWLHPHCEAETASLLYTKGATDGPGWVNGADDVIRAVTAFRAGTLRGYPKSSADVTQGKSYG